LSPDRKQLDPCTDFDKFTCDGWLSKHEWRPDQSVVSGGSVMGDTIKTILHNILEGKYAGKVLAEGTNFDMENFNLMKEAYDTCMDEDRIASYGIKPMTDMLEEFSKVFPRTGKPVYGQESNDELTDTAIWLLKRQVSGVVSADTGVSKTCAY
jgi:endothelin-converting enzyme